jgi:hypothetical protein
VAVGTNGRICTWFDVGIDNTSDIIAVCITPLTTTIASNAVINYKDY